MKIDQEPAHIKKIFNNFTLSPEIDILAMTVQSQQALSIENKSVLVIGQEKGEDLNSRIDKNFGMMSPEGYRKCIRLMKLANRFKIPIVTFIDTPGALPEWVPSREVVYPQLPTR